MSTLVAIGYDDPYKAEEVRLMLRKMQKEYLVDLDDVLPDRRRRGERRVLGIPLLGMAVGATAGAVSGALTDVGLEDTFMKDLATTLKPGSSVLFALVRTATPERVLDELKGTGGTVLRSNLAHEDEARLQKALSAARAA
jgi:uncharacterized membrane protein